VFAPRAEAQGNGEIVTMNYILLTTRSAYILLTFVLPVCPKSRNPIYQHYRKCSEMLRANVFVISGHINICIIFFRSLIVLLTPIVQRVYMSSGGEAPLIINTRMNMMLSRQHCSPVSCVDFLIFLPVNTTNNRNAHN
jgi:hypothetical protein